MNPLYIGAAAVLALFAAGAGGASASTQATQQKMVFKDYTWIVVLPSTSTNPIAPGPMAPSSVAAIPPPPGQSPSSGRWFEYPGGNQLTSPIQDAVTGATKLPGTPQNPVLGIWPAVPAGLSVFAWKPNKNTLQNLNGYWVLTTNWTWAHADQAGGSMHPYYPYGSLPRYIVNGPVPSNPPGEKAGSWHQVHPGYLVFITPTNANTAELASQAFAFSPTAAAAPAPSPALPAPSSSPIGVTTTTGAAFHPTFGAPMGAGARGFPARTHLPHFA